MKHAMLETGSRTFIALEKGFHGKTLGAVQLTANEDYREPFLIDGLTVHRVRVNDIAHLEQTFSRTGSIAGLIFEPIQGEGGVREISAEFAQRAAALCRARGAPLIADEIQTGMGRTGALWGVDHTGTVPDIMCLGKSIGGGVMPLSAFIATPEIWEVLIPNPIIHSTTFGGNPMACAAGIAAIQVTLEEDLPGQAAAKGEFLLRELGTLRAKYPQVLSDVHGKGLLIGMEFPTDETGFRCAAGLFKRGVLVAGTYSKARTIRIEPALGISMELLNEMLTRLEDTLCEVAKGA
jgi:putrescine aminotransferase